MIYCLREYRRYRFMHRVFSSASMTPHFSLLSLYSDLTDHNVESHFVGMVMAAIHEYLHKIADKNVRFQYLI